MSGTQAHVDSKYEKLLKIQINVSQTITPFISVHSKSPSIEAINIFVYLSFTLQSLLFVNMVNQHVTST